MAMPFRGHLGCPTHTGLMLIKLSLENSTTPEKILEKISSNEHINMAGSIPDGRGYCTGVCHQHIQFCICNLTITCLCYNSRYFLWYLLTNSPILFHLFSNHISFSCACLVIDDEFHHNIVKVVCRSTWLLFRGSTTTLTRLQ